MRHFKVERIVPDEENTGGLRFTASDGGVDLEVHGDGRATLWASTYNGTSPEVFANRLWGLLHDVMPELGLKVVSAEVHLDEPDCEFQTALLIWSGFKHEGTRRQWGEVRGQLHDVDLYSILDTEVRYEVKEKENGVFPAG